MKDRELCREVAGLIAMASSYSGLKEQDLAKILNCAPDTFSRKKNNVMTFTLKELFGLAELAGKEITFTDGR